MQGICQCSGKNAIKTEILIYFQNRNVVTRVAKKPEFSKPAPPLIFDPSRVPAPKKLEAKKAQPALPRP